MAMKTEHHSGYGQLDERGSDHWVELSGDHHSPYHEYAQYGFVSHAHIPSDSINDRSPEASYSPPPLYMPQWPSQLTSPSQGPQPPPMSVVRPIAPATSLSPVQPVKLAAEKLAPPLAAPATSNARKTLTDSDRRRMCEYHEENPTVKQTEIGAMFGVERSTVSKVLRQKDKFLAVDDGGQSPIKRSKGKFPDIERALAVWARNHQRQGLPLNDDEIRDKARFFAHTVGSSDCHAKVNSSAWLEKFKQKNVLNGAKSRKISVDPEDTDLIDGIPINESKSGSQTPNGLSPISPDTKTEPSDSYIDFAASYRNVHSESVTSLASCYSETTVSTSFSPDIRSPTSPFFSPDSSCGPSPLIPSQHSRLPPLASAASRPRRQTFPAIGAGAFVTDPPVSEPPSMKYSHSSMAVPTLGSPLEEMEESPLSSQTPMPQSTQQSHHTTPILSPIPSSMAPPPLTSGHNSPNPPSQDEARRAMETLMAFFENQPTNGVDPHEYFLMGKLMEKLKLQGGALPGGMHSLERGDGTLPIGRKRSIHSL